MALAVLQHTRAAIARIGAKIGESKVDDDLLRHLVFTTHSDRRPLSDALGMAALVLVACWRLTGQAAFLWLFAANLIIGVARVHLLSRYRRLATPTDSRESTLAFDAAFSRWATFYALNIGVAAALLAALPDPIDSLPVAVAIPPAFAISFAARSSGRPRTLFLQVMAICGPAIAAMLLLNPPHGVFYASVFAAAASSSLVTGRATRAKVVEIYNANAANRRMARIDILTGALNRFAFSETLAQAIADPQQRPAERIALIVVDLDRFKDINDGYGHSVGDAVIVEAARRLRATARAQDCVARLGGDEFVVLVRGERIDEAGAARICGQLLDALRRPVEFEGQVLELSASLGASIWPDHGTAPDELFKHADLALYQAKRAGRGRFAVYSQSPDTSAVAA